jgi:hypothetical protein
MPQRIAPVWGLAKRAEPDYYRNSPFHQQPGSECNRLWLLKNSIFFKTARIWGIENVWEN